MTSGLTRQGRGGRRAPTALVVLALLAVLLGGALLTFAARGQVPDPPSPVASTPSSTSATATPERPPARPGPTPGPTPAAAPGATEPLVTTQAEPTTQEEPTAEEERGFDPLPASPPTRVRIPAIEVTSPLHPLGLSPDGTLLVPSGDRYDEAAWYSGSPTPGETGPTVLEGHVTGPGGRSSVFFELGALRAGDLVEVDREDGSTVTFEVYRTDRFAKDDFPTVDVYGPTGDAELRLITCGGEFDQEVGHHLDNTVVFGRAVGSDQG